MKIAYDSTNYIIKYNDAIQSGKIVAGEKIKKLYAQLAKDCKRKKRFHFDIKQASRVIYFVETFCRQSKGEMGKPIKLELFQKAALQAIFGFVDDEGTYANYSPKESRSLPGCLPIRWQCFLTSEDSI